MSHILKSSFNPQNCQIEFLMYLREMGLLCLKDFFTFMFSVALVTVDQIWNKSKCLPAKE